MDWRVEGACASLPINDADKVFFPRGKKNIAKAKEICGKCEVVGKCLAYAKSSDVKGVWGGTTYEERHPVPEPRRCGGRVINITFS